jgi:hypothetical protein
VSHPPAGGWLTFFVVRFVQQLGGGIIGIIIAYLFLTIMRDVRNKFMVNIGLL